MNYLPLITLSQLALQKRRLKLLNQSSSNAVTQEKITKLPFQHEPTAAHLLRCFLAALKSKICPCLI